LAKLEYALELPSGYLLTVAVGGEVPADLEQQIRERTAVAHSAALSAYEATFEAVMENDR